ncbi:MAG: TonB-dependent receptor SusC [Candidatus Ordinivivax streblomastigis]|uniref:TonB-dependent receptor SusC n=1 Tax=Candidatus Ordinivivax streblomastigis TaxID=2540710 RepID=A0A5M8NX32_9BACT|nr:MAG: TonB-dependent receptor SusC [Candidatus Ordinivivax streblomastigis]
MKIFSIFLIVTLLHIAAAGYSQTAAASIYADHMALEQLFASLTVVPNSVLSPNNLKYTLMENDLVVVAPLEVKQQQGITITGKVTDANGGTLPGVNVTVKGTQIGVISDIDGKYSINVPNNNAALVFSFVGYATREQIVGAQRVIDINLFDDARVIEEVVVVGYGTQKKLTLTGSVVSTSGESIQKSAVVDLSQSLAGRMPGVIVNNRSGEPGMEATSILIRGRSTLGENSPLIIIDGVPGRESLSYLNPNDIENITVLKDASASIYGNRSANGVILVTTRRGKAGEKPSITFSYDLGIQQPTRLLKMTDAATYAELYNERNMKVAGQPDFSQYREDEIQKYRDGSDPVQYPNTDWFNAIIKPASFQHKYNLSFSGGTNVVAYFVSLGAVTQDGIYRESATKYDQLNLRSNIDVNVTQDFKIGVDVSARIQDKHYSAFPSDNYGIFYRTRDRRPTLPEYYPGELLSPDNHDQLLAGVGNPLALVSDITGYDKTHLQRLNTTLSGDYNLDRFVKGLSIKGHVAYDNNSSFRKQWKTPYTYYSFMPATATEARRVEPYLSTDPPTPQLLEGYIPDWALTLNATINYDRIFDEIHHIGMMAGVERSSTRQDQMQAEINQYSQDVLDEFFAGDKDKTYFSIDGKAAETARLGYFGRLSYDYKGKYLAQFLARYDGSENFPKEKRWGFFPSASIGWRISEEGFIKDNLPWVNNLKIRASYGEQGNDRIAAFQYLALFQYGRSQIMDGKPVAGIYPSIFPNNEVTWEVAKTSNLGLDGTLWDGKLGFEIEIFKTERSNILLPQTGSVPQFTGLTGSLPDVNIGIVKNKGFEFQLSHAGKSGEFTYNIGGNFLFVRNTVVFTDETPWGDGYEYLAAEGHPMGSRLLYEVIGINKTEADLQKYPQVSGATLGDFIYKRNDPNPVNPNAITLKDRKRVDLSTVPEIVYGLSFDAHWRLFDLTMLLQGQARAKYYVSPRIDPAEGNIMQDIADGRWSLKNPTADKPGVGGSINNAGVYESTYWHRDASFLRLKNLEIGFTLPKNWLAQDITRAQNLRIYIGGYNLLTFDSLKIVDPESSSSDQQNYPQLRIFNAGVKLTF